MIQSEHTNKVKTELLNYKFSIFVILLFMIQYMLGQYHTGSVFLLRQFTIMTFMTIGMSLEMISGDFDLACAAQISVSTMTAAYLVTSGMTMIAACLSVLVLNALLGMLKAVLITRLNMPSIIVTLALQVILMNLYPGISSQDHISFRGWLTWPGGNRWELFFGVILLLSVAGVYIFLNHTYYGKYCRVLGENIDLARKSGLQCTAISIVIHLGASLFFSAAAIQIMLYTGSGGTNTGAGYLYKVLAAVCIGGIGYHNGRGRVSGMLIGSLTMVLIILMLTSYGYLNWLETIIEGIIILLALRGNMK